MVRGELVDESGGSPPEWIGLIRAARNPQEQTLEAIADLPGGQVLWAPSTLANSIYLSVPKVANNVKSKVLYLEVSFKRSNHL
jgi:hypothetical protein